MKAPTIEDFECALSDLEFGSPGKNEPYDTGSGELDNGETRLLLAGAVWTVVRFNSEKAFESLNKYFDGEISGWFHEKRAELILTMLLYQVNWNDFSTWLSRYAQDLTQLEALPDPRWKAVCTHLNTPSSLLITLAHELTRRLDVDKESVIREKREMNRLLSNWKKL